MRQSARSGLSDEVVTQQQGGGLFDDELLARVCRMQGDGRAQRKLRTPLSRALSSTLPFFSLRRWSGGGRVSKQAAR